MVIYLLLLPLIPIATTSVVRAVKPDHSTITTITITITTITLNGGYTHTLTHTHTRAHTHARTHTHTHTNTIDDDAVPFNSSALPSRECVREEGGV